MILRVDTASIAHLDHPRCRGRGEHRVIARQFFDDLLDGRLDAKQCAAFDAGEWLFLVQNLLRKCRIGQIELRGQCDRLFRTNIDAEPALQTGIAPEGHNDTQARHIVQASVSTMTAP